MTRAAAHSRVSPSRAQSRLFPTAKVGTGTRPGLEAQIAAAGMPEPEPEYQFATVIGRKWAFDYCWPSLQIAFEIEGGAFGRYLVVQVGYERRRGQTIPLKEGTVIRAGGRHNTGEGMEQDCEKYSRAAILGWCVVRCTTRQIRDGVAIELLSAAFAVKGWKPDVGSRLDEIEARKHQCVVGQEPIKSHSPDA
jgi:hypothetical protein